MPHKPSQLTYNMRERERDREREREREREFVQRPINNIYIYIYFLYTH